MKQGFYNLIEEQKNDPKLKIIRENIANQPLYELIEDCLYKTHQGISQVCLPGILAEELASNCHEIYGHVVPRKCYLMFPEDFHRPGLLKRIKRRLKTCQVCQLNKVSTQSSFSPSQPIILSQPLEAVFIDFYGPLPTARYGFKYILANLDGFSKYVKLFPFLENRIELSWTMAPNSLRRSGKIN